MTEWRQTEIGLIPKDWEVRHFGEVGDVYSGFAFKSADFVKSGIPVVKIGELQSGRIVFTGKTDFVNEDFIKNQKLKKFILQAGDLLIAMTGATTGKVARVRKENLPCLLNQRVGKIASISERLDNNFIVYLIQTSVAQQFIQNQILKSAQGNVSPTGIKNILIPLPSPNEQQSVAHILSKIQSAIETQEKIIQTTTELKKALMQKLFTEGLKGEPQKETEIGKVPKSWEVVQLGDVCSQRKETVNPNANGKGVYVGLEHIQSGEFRLYAYGNESQVRSAKFKFYEGDILYGKLRPYLDKAVLTNTSGICSTDIIVLRGTERLLQSYLLGLIHTSNFVGYSKRTTSGVNHPRTSWNLLKKFKFGLPGIEEQEEIGLVFQQLTNKIETHQSKMGILQSLFNSMLYNLMTGQIRVKDLKIKASESA